MQMVLASTFRNAVLCFLAQALLAPGFSVQSFLSYRSVIPDDQRVGSVASVTANLVSGTPLERIPPPAPPPAPAADWNAIVKSATASVGASVAAASTASGATSSNQASAPNPIGARMWKIEATVEMRTSAPVFTDEYADSVEGVAVTLADRLMWATDVPMSRFSFWLPDPAASDASNIIYCESNSNEARAGGWASRFSTAKNTTYHCEPQKHQMNATTPGQVLLQRSTATAKVTSLSLEVGVYPASGVSGDTKPAVQVVEELVSMANSGDEPERILHKDGNWTYEAGPGVKFLGLLPATAASMPGTPFKERDTSLPLGPNPGGHGGTPPPKLPPGTGKGLEHEKERMTYFANVETTVAEAHKINFAVNNSLQELKDSLARASAVHNAWMSWNPYKPPVELMGP